MLELAIRPSDPKAAEIVTKHVNSQLLQVMREKIYEYAVYEKSAKETVDKIKSGEIKVDPNDRTAHLPELPHISKLDEVVDFGELMDDEGFAESVSLLYLPKYYRSRPAMEANQQFISLYKLLKAKNEYLPELPMQYILYQLICETADVFSDSDSFKDEDEESALVERIPEPDRSYVLEKLREELDPELAPKDYIGMFEDFSEYEEMYFEDVDFAMLGYVDEKTFRSTPFADYIGLQNEQGKQEMDLNINGKNIHTEIKIAPWELEE